MKYQIALNGDMRIIPETAVETLTLELMADYFNKGVTGFKLHKQTLILPKASIIASIFHLIKLNSITLEDIHKAVALDAI